MCYSSVFSAPVAVASFDVGVAAVSSAASVNLLFGLRFAVGVVGAVGGFRAVGGFNILAYLLLGGIYVCGTPILPLEFYFGGSGRGGVVCFGVFGVVGTIDGFRAVGGFDIFAYHLLLLG